MTRTLLHQQTEAYKSGWARGFYGCSHENETHREEPTEVVRDRWCADFWRGFFEGKASADVSNRPDASPFDNDARIAPGILALAFTGQGNISKWYDGEVCCPEKGRCATLLEPNIIALGRDLLFCQQD